MSDDVAADLWGEGEGGFESEQSDGGEYNPLSPDTTPKAARKRPADFPSSDEGPMRKRQRTANKLLVDYDTTQGGRNVLGRRNQRLGRHEVMMTPLQAQRANKKIAREGYCFEVKSATTNYPPPPPTPVARNVPVIAHRPVLPAAAPKKHVPRPKGPASPAIKPKKANRPKAPPAAPAYAAPVPYEAPPKNKRVPKHLAHLSAPLQYCGTIIDKLLAHMHAWPFSVPVDPVVLGIPDYFNVIEHPMDLGTIKEKLENGEYTDHYQFQSDVRLVFENCRKFNPPNSDVVMMGNQVEHEFLGLWLKLPPAPLHPPPAVPSPAPARAPAPPRQPPPARAPAAPAARVAPPPQPASTPQRMLPVRQPAMPPTTPTTPATPQQRMLPTTPVATPQSAQPAMQREFPQRVPLVHAAARTPVAAAAPPQRVFTPTAAPTPSPAASGQRAFPTMQRQFTPTAAAAQQRQFAPVPAPVAPPAAAPPPQRVRPTPPALQVPAPAAAPPQESPAVHKLEETLNQVEGAFVQLSSILGTMPQQAPAAEAAKPEKKKKEKKKRRSREAASESESGRSSSPGAEHEGDVRERRMDQHEKRKLSQDIERLAIEGNKKTLNKILEIIKQSMPHLKENGEEEIEIDIDALDNATLRKLQVYVNERVEGRMARQRKKADQKKEKEARKLAAMSQTHHHAPRDDRLEVDANPSARRAKHESAGADDSYYDSYADVPAYSAPAPAPSHSRSRPSSGSRHVSPVPTRSPRHYLASNGNVPEDEVSFGVGAPPREASPPLYEEEVVPSADHNTRGDDVELANEQAWTTLADQDDPVRSSPSRLDTGETSKLWDDFKQHDAREKELQRERAEEEERVRREQAEQEERERLEREEAERERIEEEERERLAKEEAEAEAQRQLEEEREKQRRERESQQQEVFLDAGRDAMMGFGDLSADMNFDPAAIARLRDTS